MADLTSISKTDGPGSADTAGGESSPRADAIRAAADVAQARSPWMDTMTVEGEKTRRWGPPVLLAVVALLVTAGALGATRLPGGSRIAGVGVTNAAGVEDALDRAQAALNDAEVRLVTAVDTSADTTGGDLVLAVDRDESAAPTRAGLPSLSAWATRLFTGAPDLPLAVEVADEEAAAALAEQISLDPVDAEVVAELSGVEVIEGRDGLAVSAADVRTAVAGALDDLARTPPEDWPSPIEVTVGGTPESPAVGQDDIDSVVAEIERLQSADITVTAQVEAEESAAAEDEDATDDDADAEPQQPPSIDLAPGDIRRLIEVVTVADAPAGQRLQVVPAEEADVPPALSALMDLTVVAGEVEAHIEDRSPTPRRDDDLTAVDEIEGTIVTDAVGRGTVPDVEATLTAILDAAASGGGDVDVVTAASDEVTPADLGIVEPVSTFTTFYTPGQSRVTNIRRFAELVDGTVIPPGESLELNDLVGRRTRENGFVEGGAILDGELVSDVGGGVSQFATTFFNAAWFAGIELVEWKAHSFYFSRYPPGREATINYPNVDLEVRNNTPYGILVDTDTNSDSVTVTFWSTPHFDVQTIMGPCGCGGSFAITNQRIVTPPGGEPVTEEYRTVYTVPRS